MGTQERNEGKMAPMSFSLLNTEQMLLKPEGVGIADGCWSWKLVYTMMEPFRHIDLDSRTSNINIDVQVTKLSLKQHDNRFFQQDLFA